MEEKEVTDGKGLRVAGLVLGIVGLVMALIDSFVFAWLAVLCLPVSIVGLVLSCVGRKKAKDGIGTAGLVIGIIAVVFSAITFFTCGICVICVAAGATAA